MQTENLLSEARRRFPELYPHDAFIAPAWYFSQENWISGADQASAAAYNYPLGLRIRGPLNRAAAQKSVDALIHRHEVLRSAFRIYNGAVLQIIRRASQSALSVIDLSGVKRSRREAQARYVAAHCAKAPFDFSLGPLLRAAAITLEGDDHVVLLTTHHLVCDDWSVGILVRDFLALYNAFRAGAAAPELPELPFKYGDFVRWRDSDAKQPAISQSRDFWKQELSQPGRPASIAPNKPFLAQRTFQGAHETLNLPHELLRELTDISQRERVSLFMTLLAGFQLLLKHYSGNSLVSVGCCVANRERPDTELLVGPFANVVVLRTSLEDQLSIRQVIGRVRERALDAYSHQDFPFGELVQEMGCEADAAGNPFFQVLFVLQNAPKPCASANEISCEDFPVDMGTTRYDLNLWLKAGDGLALDLQYNTNLFNRETIAKVLRDYKNTLEWMVRNTDVRISTLFSADRKPGAQSASAPTPAIQFHPRDEYEKTLLSMWRKAFKNDELEADADFFETGGDSLLAARLFADIQSEFGIRLPLSALCNAPTVKKLAACLRGAKKNDPQNSFVAIRTRGSRPPLLIIHEHGGEVLYARELASHLHPDQPVYAFQSRYDHGAPEFSTVEQMARAYVQELLAHRIRGPFFIFGYCFGGLIGLEMAARLKAAGKHAELAMLDTPAPGSLRYWPFPGLRHVPARTRFFLQDFWALEPAHMPDFVSRKFRGAARALLANGTRSRKSDEKSAPQIELDALATRGVHIWQVHLNAARSYRPQSIADELTLFVTPEAPSSYDFDLRAGWKTFAESVRIVNIPGNVTTVMREPHVAALATKLTNWMAQTPSASIESDLPIDDAPKQSRRRNALLGCRDQEPYIQTGSVSGQPSTEVVRAHLCK